MSREQMLESIIRKIDNKVSDCCGCNTAAYLNDEEIVALPGDCGVGTVNETEEQSFLNRDADGQFTPASLRNHYRHRLSTMEEVDRYPYAYGVLSSLAQAPTGSWTREQGRAIAEGLDQGMKD